MNITTRFFLVVIWVLLLSCPSPQELEDDRNTTIHLELIDTWTTSAILKLSVDDTTQSWNFALTRNDSIVLGGQVWDSDTTITDIGLVPARDYAYTAYFIDDSESVDSSFSVHLTTLDTTSSEFTWTLDTMGIYYSMFRDVKIVNENDIWAVGRIRMLDPDSSSGGPKEYFNVAHWDGSNWELSSAYYGSVETYSITYFDEDDFWITSLSFPLHWDGNEWTLYHLQNMGLNVSAGRSSWGTSSDNMWFVGNFGSIVHYDGTTFTKIESGTLINLLSVSGTPDGEHVFVTGVNQYYNSVILHIEDLVSKIIYEGETAYTIPAGAPFTTYVYEDTAYFASGLGVWKYNFITESSSVVYESQNYEGISPHSIQLTSQNDIFMCGARSELIHYNGIRWTSDLSVWGQFGYSGVASYGMDVKGDQVVIVGYCYGSNQSLIARGRR